MSDFSDDPNLSEQLDDDKLPPEYPPDRPLGVDQYGITPAEEEVDEPLWERVKREVPDVQPREDDSEYGQPVSVLVEPDQGMIDADDEPDAVASESGMPIGELPIDADDIAFGDDTLRDVAQEREGTDLSAEEAAMHITAPPPMGDGDGYLEDE
jgi:hypothetical protein